MMSLMRYVKKFKMSACTCVSTGVTKLSRDFGKVLGQQLKREF